MFEFFRYKIYKKTSFIILEFIWNERKKKVNRQVPQFWLDWGKEQEKKKSILVGARMYLNHGSGNSTWYVNYETYQLSEQSSITIYAVISDS